MVGGADGPERRHETAAELVPAIGGLRDQAAAKPLRPVGLR
jgi:hypothetical protein